MSSLVGSLGLFRASDPEQPRIHGESSNGLSPTSSLESCGGVDAGTELSHKHSHTCMDNTGY